MNQSDKDELPFFPDHDVRLLLKEGETVEVRKGREVIIQANGEMCKHRSHYPNSTYRGFLARPTDTKKAAQVSYS
ncbi:hypothetical protein OAU26_02235 [Mariniblastus sp.]|nr:hypothetical protein [bacterium]MDC0265496.1 hypothetical protein [Mariniblastus sp.]MDC3223730.1 hypothetical protein [Mariniblastus sp.]